MLVGYFNMTAFKTAIILGVTIGIVSFIGYRVLVDQYARQQF